METNSKKRTRTPSFIRKKPPKIKNEKKAIRHSHIRSYYKKFLGESSYDPKRIGFAALDVIAFQAEDIVKEMIRCGEKLATRAGRTTITEEDIVPYYF